MKQRSNALRTERAQLFPLAKIHRSHKCLGNGLYKKGIKKKMMVFNPDLPGGSVAKTLPANAGDWG